MSRSTTTLIDSESDITSGCSTLVDLVRWRARHQAERTAYVFLSDGATEECRLTYVELDQQARAVGGWLQSLVSRGERVLLIYPPGLDYLTAFFGCLYAGAIAVPAYPPRNNRNMWRLQLLIADAEPALALTTEPILSRVIASLDRNPELEKLRWLTSGKISTADDHWKEPALAGDDLAFLQYTS